MLGNLFTLGVGFPFQIYLARKLGADQLGAYGLMEVVAQTGAALLEFGLGLTLVRFIPQLLGLGQNRHARKLLATAYSVILLAGLCVAVLLMVGAPYLTAWMPELQSYAHLFPFVGVMALVGMLTGLS
jgi:O-antigen/teichoic acid export membrane protein